MLTVLCCNAYLVGGPEACGEHSDLQVHGQGLVSCVLTLPVLKALLLVTRQLQVSHHALHLQPQLPLVSTTPCSGGFVIVIVIDSVDAPCVKALMPRTCLVTPPPPDMLV